MPTTLQTRQITEEFRNFPQKLKRYVSSITGSRTSGHLLISENPPIDLLNAVKNSGHSPIQEED